MRAAMALFAAAGIATAWAADEGRNATPAEQSVDNGAGTNAPNAATGSSRAMAGGTGSGADTTGSPGVAVDEGTVMRPLSAQGRNGVARKDVSPEPHRRTQLYGLNPKADEPSASQGSTR
jgi:hypothetical protein